MPKTSLSYIRMGPLVGAWGGGAEKERKDALRRGPARSSGVSRESVSLAQYDADPICGG